MKRSRGQTLVITLIVLFVLTTLGFVLMLVLGRQVGSTGVARSRNIANDLAQAGIRYSYAQLRFSEDGADWRPQPPIPVVAPALGEPPGLGPESDPESPTATNPDPDFNWLRRRTDFVALNPADKGGPDGLGCYTRLNYDTGRALVRVRYAPSGEEIFDQPLYDVNLKGKLRHYTIIEVAGRPGKYNALDPTSSRTPALQNARELTAIVPIGIIESAYYATDKDERNQPVDYGNPLDMGANFMGTPVATRRVLGGTIVPRPGGLSLILGGSMYINSGARFFGDTGGQSGMEVFLNSDLGDQIVVAGDITFAESNAPLVLNQIVGGATTVLTPTASANAAFNTFRGSIRDGREGQDAQGFPRVSPRKEPPLIDEEDPNTGQQRYRLATRSSGFLNAFNNNVGQYGYGRGPFINNSSDLNRDSENGNYSQRTDWLNPGKHPNGYWQGPYYVPPAVHIQLDPGGFTISRNVRNQRDTWRSYDGQDTGRHTLRFKLGFPGTNVRDLRIINELTPGVANFGNPSAADYGLGVPFNGIIFAEGNVRLRGIIPAIPNPQGQGFIGVQMTIVSLGTGYVEGSIIKGHPETSSLAFLCRDNVALNTSQFVGPSLNTTLRIASDNNDPTSPARVKVETGANFDLLMQLPLDPLTGNPSISGYTYTNPNRGAGNPINASLWMAHAADFDKSAFFNLLINPDTTANSEFLFENQDPPNAAAPIMAALFPPGTPIPTYGLANPTFQVLPIYEKRRFELFPIAAGTNGNYTLLTGGVENTLRLKTDNTINVGGRGDYFFSKAAVMPMDVRVEAALYAQEGSFFVIPGPWMNSNPNDRRDAFTNANDRFANFQTSVEYPFYGEPNNIKVTIVGSVSENFPPTMADQAQWLQHWGWMPAEFGESGQYVPDQHFPRVPGTNNPDFTNSNYVPNLFINYDPTFISGRRFGSFDFTNVNAPYVRTDNYGRPLPPCPKLPVGTKMFYFGEVNP